MAVTAPPPVSPVLPRADAQFAASIGGRLVPAKEWFDFFRALRSFVDGNSDLQSEIDAILERLGALEGAQIVGLNSVETFGSLSDGLVTVMLRGDVAAPGVMQYYGTGPAGERGFWPATSLVAWLVDRSGNYITDRAGNYIVAQDITPQLFAITGTEPGILAHVSPGVWASRTIGTSGDPGITVADGGGVAGNPTISHGFGATLSAGGTTGQFWRGDKTWSNALTNDLIVNTNGLAVVGTDVGVGTLTPALAGSGRQFTVSSAVAAGDFVRINLQGNVTAANGAIGTLDVYNAAAGLAVAQWQTFRDGANDAAGQIWTTRATGGGLTQRFVLMSNGNMGFFTTLASVSFGSGVGVAYVRNATTLPTTNPVGGGILYADAGAGKWLGSSGTVTTFGPADPHCPECGSDFVHEWDNPEKYGYLAVCMYCFADGVHSVTRTRGAWSTHKG